MDIRDPKYAYSLFMSEIQHAQSEVLIAVNSILHLEYLAETGLVDSLKQAQSNAVNVMILYSEERQNKDDTTSQIVSTIKNYAQIKCVSGIYGTIFLIDNSKVLTINEGDDATKAFVVYSNNKSIVKNIGSLLDSLWNEKEMLDSIIAIKDNLADSNKQLAEANEQLKIHDKIQREFINMAAHELRTPITPILGYAEILEAEQEKEEQEGIAGEKENDRNKNKRNNINAIIRNAKRLKQVSQRILDTASIEAKIFKLDKERLNLADVLLNAVDDQIITIAQDFEIKNNIKLRYEPSEDIILIHADRIRLTQVISNILSNAVKFTKKGTISITIKKENDNAIVGIQDTGLGIDAQIMSRLFSKFATKSDIGGTGLGLFICKSIIEAHGGTISAGNNEDGKRGATFTFTLPISK
ncbi:MAG: HAMP domain-containing sensor histidine kinase [Candidatus Nitrosopolaris sp.]|jgi:signal transduction histidine kinase